MLNNNYEEFNILYLKNITIDKYVKQKGFISRTAYELYKTGFNEIDQKRCKSESCIKTDFIMDKYFDGDTFKTINDVCAFLKNYNVEIIVDNHDLTKELKGSLF